MKATLTLPIQSLKTRESSLPSFPTASSHRRHILPTNRTLQPIPHPTLQTAAVENVPARRNHVRPPREHCGRRHPSSRRSHTFPFTSPGSRHDRDFDVLGADRTIKHFLTLFATFARFRGCRTSGRRLREPDRHRRAGFLVVVFAQDRVVVICRGCPAVGDEEARR